MNYLPAVTEYTMQCAVCQFSKIFEIYLSIYYTAHR